MYGVVTRNEDETDWPEFDRSFHEVKAVSGRSSEPVPDTVSMISCFADNAAADGNPDLVPVTADGQAATPERRYFDWAYICPTHDEYKKGLLEIIEDTAAETPNIRLDDIGFPRPEYCYCDRCNERYESWVRTRYENESGPAPEETTVGDRYAWRAETISEFVTAAADRIPGRTYMTLYPDPYEGHLYERAGVDLSAVEPDVDEFVIPLYDTHYGTTYWLETIASGFQDRLETPFSIELYAVDVDIDNLLDAVAVADEYAESVLFGYDAANARAALRRMDADSREGVEW